MVVKLSKCSLSCTVIVNPTKSNGHYPFEMSKIVSGIHLNIGVHCSPSCPTSVSTLHVVSGLGKRDVKGTKTGGDVQPK